MFRGNYNASVMIAEDKACVMRVCQCLEGGETVW